ncbi:molybdopterin-dependent oxidoreductase [Microbacterium luticocti]|uniref:molybdopterin-dependent oxidoreductase n=1 Tax=Microbacterium luticocti TaxID=451764 RepID=UPI0003F7A094|nr:molybdopterin-dependent oxidoreductase [Microbacterium luticocti]
MTETPPGTGWPGTGGLGRRGFLIGTGVAAVGLVALTAGQSFDALAPVNAFAPRTIGAGPLHVPVNRTARQAEVESAASAPDWTLEVAGPNGTLAFSRDRLLAMPQAQARLPIACVEGWSTVADWTGVRLCDLLDAAGIPADRTVELASLQRRGPYRTTTMPPAYARDPLTLVALALNGQPLDLDHGYPARVIAPGRPGVLQTKWLRSIREAP